MSQHADPVMASLLQFVGSTQIDRPGFVFGFLRRRGVPEATVEEVSLRTLLRFCMALVQRLLNNCACIGKLSSLLVLTSGIVDCS